MIGRGATCVWLTLLPLPVSPAGKILKASPA